jgi:phosphopantetheinyl transferase
LTPEHATLAPHPPLGERDLHVWVVPLDDPDKKRRRELAHLAEGIVLASYLGVTPAMLEFERGPGGKPRLRDEPLQYNLSHSEGVALVGVSLALPLGVDVQGPHPSTEKSWFAKRICSPREYEHFGGAPGVDDLLRLWARKEAVVKARGEGSYVAVGEIDVLDMEIDGSWRCVDIPSVELAAWPGFHAAVAFRYERGPRAEPWSVTLTTQNFLWP